MNERELLQLKKDIDSLTNTTISDIHLDILAIAVGNGDKIDKRTLDVMYQKNIDYKLAFRELLDWKYFQNSDLMTELNTGIVEYNLTKGKLVEIYKELKKHNRWK